MAMHVSQIAIQYSVYINLLFEEFTAFLNERAAVGAQVPTMPDVPTNPISQNDETTSDPRQRKMETGNQPMFGL